MYGTRVFAVSVEDDGSGTVVLDLATAGQSGTVPLDEALDTLESPDGHVTGVVLTGGEEAFGELDGDAGAGDVTDAAVLFSHVQEAKSVLRRLETLPVPVVAAVDGSVLGTGLELALSAHHRIAVDAPDARAGFTALQIGLTPAMGGVVRTVRLLGIENGLSAVLLTGAPLTIPAARAAGLIDDTVASPDQLLPAARAWIAEQREPPVQTWDRPGYAMPGGAPDSPSVTASLGVLPSQLRMRLGGADYLAPKLVMSAAVEGAQVDFETALRIESRYFVTAANSGQHGALADLAVARRAVLERYVTGEGGLRAPDAVEGDGVADASAFGGAPAFGVAFAEGVRLPSRVLDVVVPRLVAAYVLEAVSLLHDAFPAVLVERAARVAGFRTPPLELVDRVGLPAVLDLPDVRAASCAPGAELLRALADDGRGGFYADRAQEGPPHLARTGGKGFTSPGTAVEQAADRLVQAMRAAARTTVAERALHTEDVDVIALIVLGYPPRLGGVLGERRSGRWLAEATVRAGVSTSIPVPAREKSRS